MLPASDHIDYLQRFRVTAASTAEVNRADGWTSLPRTPDYNGMVNLNSTIQKDYFLAVRANNPADCCAAWRSGRQKNNEYADSTFKCEHVEFSRWPRWQGRALSTDIILHRIKGFSEI